MKTTNRSGIRWRGSAISSVGEQPGICRLPKYDAHLLQNHQAIYHTTKNFQKIVVGCPSAAFERCAPRWRSFGTGFVQLDQAFCLDRGGKQAQKRHDLHEELLAFLAITLTIDCESPASASAKRGRFNRH